MNRYSIIAAACALALTSCAKEDSGASADESGRTFYEGQQVTLSVKAGEPSTKVSSELNSSSGIDFKWETGDVIKVTEPTSGKYSYFTLTGGAGQSSATFSGVIPATGTTYNIQYPASDPVLTSQTYSSTEALPHDKMLFTAENCSLSASSFELKAQYSALQLNLYGSKAVGSIVVTTNEATPKTYTLDCSGTGSGTEPGKTSEPKPFYIVVPAGTYGFTVTIKDVSSGVISSKSTTSNKTFEANKFLKMPPLGYPGTDVASVTIGGVIWAPVNCGYDATDYPYGRLYQWGRKYGQGYNDSSYSDGDYPGKSGGSQSLEDISALGVLESHPDGDTYNGKFYYVLVNWYDGTNKDALWGATKTDYDPCPAGWRVPTYAELNALTGNNGSTSIGGNGWDSTNKGYWFNGTTSPVKGNGLFLPVAGSRYYLNGNALYRGSNGYYWSSSVDDGNNAKYLYFSGIANMATTCRAGGFSVRCVQE